jgi:hypothetical protein
MPRYSVFFKGPEDLTRRFDRNFTDRNFTPRVLVGRSQLL